MEGRLQCSYKEEFIKTFHHCRYCLWIWLMHLLIPCTCRGSACSCLINELKYRDIGHWTLRCHNKEAIYSEYRYKHSFWDVFWGIMIHMTSNPIIIPEIRGLLPATWAPLWDSRDTLTFPLFWAFVICSCFSVDRDFFGEIDEHAWSPAWIIICKVACFSCATLVRNFSCQMTIIVGIIHCRIQ